MYIIVEGLVEIEMEYERTGNVVIERLGSGTVYNPHNYLCAKKTFVSAKVTTPNSLIYSINKENFYKIAVLDKKLLKKILANLMLA